MTDIGNNEPSSDPAATAATNSVHWSNTTSTIMKVVDEDTVSNMPAGSAVVVVDDGFSIIQRKEAEMENEKPQRPSTPTKQRLSTEVGNDIGAVQVDEEAPQLNRRFYLGLDRASVMFRRRQARAGRRRQRRPTQRETADNGEAPEASSGGDRSTFVTNVRKTLFADVNAAPTDEHLITATLVEECEGEIVEAEQVGFFAKNWKPLASGLSALLVALTICLSVVLVIKNDRDDGIVVVVPSTYQPSMQPSLSPSFDLRPTLEIVQERGHLRCGISSHGRFDKDLCRAVASVIFGNESKIEGVNVTMDDRFVKLHDRNVDLFSSAIHTLEREVRESTTGAGFTFSSAYYYDGMSYFGDEDFVKCAQKKKRFAECFPLAICVQSSTIHYDFLMSEFPLKFIKVARSFDDMAHMLHNNTCNVILSDRSVLLNHPFSDDEHTIGRKTLGCEPLAIVTRNNDDEFSDITKWVVQALLYGEEKGLSRNTSLCKRYTNLTANVSDLEFLNAVYCVGKYSEIFTFEDELSNDEMNSVNNGTTGMLNEIPLGELDRIFQDDQSNGDISIGTLLGDILGRKRLNCGVIVPDEFDGNILHSTGLEGLTVEYCRMLSAALFYGDSNSTNITTYTKGDNSGFDALANGTIDVLGGARVEKKHDFAISGSVGGFRFSSPYYYGEAEVDDFSSFALATRETENSKLFSSFVNILVMGPLYAGGDNKKYTTSKEPPLLKIFGSDFPAIWALRDASKYVKKYDELYKENFGDSEARGRNQLNMHRNPQMHSFPGLG